MNTSKKQLAISIISAVLLIASVSAGVYLSSAKSENKTPIEISKQQAPTLKVDIEFKNEGKELSYQGQDAAASARQDTQNAGDRSHADAGRSGGPLLRNRR